LLFAACHGRPTRWL
jgi:hypothetical protein